MSTTFFLNISDNKIKVRWFHTTFDDILKIKKINNNNFKKRGKIEIEISRDRNVLILSLDVCLL